MDSSVAQKTKSGFCACAITFQTQSTASDARFDSLKVKIMCDMYSGDKSQCICFVLRLTGMNYHSAETESTYGLSVYNL